MSEMNRRVKSVIAVFLFSGSAGLAGALESAGHGLGLRPPTPEQREWEKKNMIVARSVRLNARGLARVNAHRAAKGLSSLSAAAVNVAPLGEEVTGIAEEDWTGDSVVSAAASAAALPRSVDNSTLKYFPPIRSQGSIGSCAQWAGMYYCFTHMAAMLRDQDAKAGGDTLRFSPKYTYNLVNGGSDSGSWYTDGWNVAKKHGAATWAAWPYDSNFRAWPLTAAIWRNALAHKTDTTGWVNAIDTTAGLDQLKTMLVNGYVLALATYVNSWQFKTAGDDSSGTADDPFIGKAVAYWVNGTAGAHAMTIVGYNDDIWVDINSNGTVDAGEKGALRIANSWGTGYREAGFTWLAYDSLKTVSGVPGAPSTGRRQSIWSAQVAWVLPKASYTPKALAQFTLNSATRNQLYVSLGISDTNKTAPTTLWTPNTLLYFAGGAYAFDGTATAVDGTFVLDFTDIAPAYGVPKRYYLRVSDSAAGGPVNVNAYKWVNVPDNAEVVRAGLPAALDAQTGTYDVDATVSTGGGGTPPTVSDVTDRSISEDGTTGAIAFTVGDAESPASDLSVTAVSNNGTLFPAGSLVVGGTGASRTLTATPPANQFGTSIVTLTVTDPSARSAQDTFVLTVTAVNDRPVGTPQTLTATQGIGKAFVLSGADVENSPLSYAVTGGPAQGTLTGTAPNLTYTPGAAYTGPDAVYFTVSDGALTSAVSTVSFTVIPPDATPPSVAFTAPADGATVSGTVAVTATAADANGVGRVVFFVNGVSVSTDTAAPYGFDWDTTRDPVGLTTLGARAFDLAGNSALATRQVTVGEGGDGFFVTPTALSFEGIQGSTNPPPSPVSVSIVGGQPIGGGWTASPSVTWLAVSPSSGTGSGVISVSANLGGLGVGTHNGSVMVSDGKTGGQSVAVTLIVIAPNDVTPPTVPTGLAAVLTGTTTVALSWNASTDIGGAGLFGYRVYRNDALLAEPTGRTLSDMAVVRGSRYRYQVSALDRAGNESARSAAVSVDVPAAPVVEVFGFPNPAVDGAAPTIRAVLGTVDSFEIAVFDTAGRLVHTDRRAGPPDGQTGGLAYYDYVWSGDIPSGLYRVVVTGHGAGGTVRVKTRVTIVR